MCLGKAKFSFSLKGWRLYKDYTPKLDLEKKKAVFIHFVKTERSTNQPSPDSEGCGAEELPQKADKSCGWQELPCMDTVFVYILSDPVFCISLSV